MKARELRIGNWVEQFIKNEGFSEIKVESDIIRSVEYHNDYGYDDDEIYYNSIPINDDWLIRFGFELEGLSYVKNMKARMKLMFFDGFISQLSIMQDDKEISFASNHLQYVHELQNLVFALTGEELKTKHDE
jgi:hypothetical protein